MAAKIIAVGSRKGGSGKTTSSVEIATALADMGKKVLALDLDEQCDFTKQSMVDLNLPNIFKLMKDDEADPHDYIVPSGNNNGYDMIPGSEELATGDLAFMDATDTYIINDIMEIVAEDYDYIIIDCAPHRNRILQMIYIAADYFVLCADENIDSLDGIKEIVVDLAKYNKKKMSNAKALGVIQVRFKRSNIHSAMQDVLTSHVEEVFDRNAMVDNPFYESVRDSVIVSECKANRIAVQHGKRYSNVALDYRHVVANILERVGE